MWPYFAAPWATRQPLATHNPWRLPGGPTASRRVPRAQKRPQSRTMSSRCYRHLFERGGGVCRTVRAEVQGDFSKYKPSHNPTCGVRGVTIMRQRTEHSGGATSAQRLQRSFRVRFSKRYGPLSKRCDHRQANSRSTSGPSKETRHRRAEHPGITGCDLVVISQQARPKNLPAAAVHNHGTGRRVPGTEKISLEARYKRYNTPS